MAGRKTESTVVLNAKLSSFNFHTMDSPAAGVTIAEGLFVVETSGRAALAGTGSRVVFVNFLKSDALSVTDPQSDPFDESGDFSGTEEVPLSSGGISALTGSLIDIGLPTSLLGGATPVVGSFITSGASGVPTVVLAGSIGTTPWFGIIHRIRDSHVFFLFSSNGTVD